MTDMPDETPQRKSSDEQTLEALDFSVSRRVPCTIEGDIGVVSDAALTRYRHALQSAAAQVGELTGAAQAEIDVSAPSDEFVEAKLRPIWMLAWDKLAQPFCSDAHDVLTAVELSIDENQRDMIRYIVSTMYAAVRDFDAVDLVIRAIQHPTLVDIAIKHAAPRLAREGRLSEALELIERCDSTHDQTSMYMMLLVEDALSNGGAGYMSYLGQVTDAWARASTLRSVLEWQVDQNCERAALPTSGVATGSPSHSAVVGRRVLRWDGARARTAGQCEDMLRRYELQLDMSSAAYEIGFGSGITLNESARTVALRVSSPVQQLAMHHGYMLGVARTISRLKQANG